MLRITWIDLDAWWGIPGGSMDKMARPMDKMDTDKMGGSMDKMDTDKMAREKR